MRIGIIARKRLNYSKRRFREEAKKLGCKMSIVDPAECEIVLGRSVPMICRKGRSIDGLQVVVPRIGPSMTQYALSIASQFELMGVPILNSAQAIASARNKLNSIQLLSRHGINIPRTIIAREPSDIAQAVEIIGGFPVILKLLSGSQGIGVMIAENMQTIESTLDTLWHLGQDILLQECIKESVGRDVRVIVIGERVVAAMRRQARIGEFRSNIHRGGLATTLDLTEDCIRVAKEATKVIGLNLAGVDFLESYSGPKVIEVNPSPGFEGMEAVTGINVAREILEYAVELGAEERSAKEA